MHQHVSIATEPIFIIIKKKPKKSKNKSGFPNWVHGKVFLIFGTTVTNLAVIYAHVPLQPQIQVQSSLIEAQDLNQSI